MTRRFEDDDEILKDGQHLRVHMYAKDGITPLPGFTDVQRAIARSHDAVTFDAASHRPGHRYPSGTNDSTNNPQSLRYGVFDTGMEKAYADADRELTNSWRGNTGAGASTGSDTNNDSRRDAQPTMDAVYSEYDLRMENSWRNQS
jgi:hypothetical protein